MKFVAAIALCFAIGCGSVSDTKSDAQRSDDDAAPVCSGGTVEACGPACVACSSTDDREVPTCDGTMCGFSCLDSAPTCTDGSCSRLRWGFDSGNLEDVEAVTPPDLTLRAAAHLGSGALAVDVTSLSSSISFKFPLCNSGMIDFSSKFLRFDVFFDGGSPAGEQYFVQASVPTPMAGAYLGNQEGIQAGINTDLSFPFADSTSSSTAAEFTIQAGSFGAAFAGTIWFDNFRIED